MNGLTGGVLQVDLTTGSWKRITIEERIWRDFLGGAGVAARLFFESEDPELDPLSADNPLYIVAGPLVGSGVPGSSRFAVCAKSPLTGIWGEATCGGNFGPEMKSAGLDAIIVRGSADHPVVLVIDGDQVEIVRPVGGGAYRPA